MEVYKLMPNYEEWEIAGLLEIPEKVVKIDVRYIRKKVSDEKDKLVIRDRLDTACKEGYENYRNSIYPVNAVWWDKYLKACDLLIKYNKSANIIFLQNNYAPPVPNDNQKKSVIEQLREKQEEYEEKKKKKLVMK